MEPEPDDTSTLAQAVIASLRVASDGRWSVVGTSGDRDGSVTVEVRNRATGRGYAVAVSIASAAGIG